MFKQIVRYAKFGAGLMSLDASTRDILPFKLTRILGFPRDEIDEVQAKYACLSPITIPKVVCKESPSNQLSPCS